MVKTQVCQWLNGSQTRKRILYTFKQPLTSRQISKKTGIPSHTCSYTIAKLVDLGVLICLNPKARSSRLYTLTADGQHYFQQFFQIGCTRPAHAHSEIDWALYGRICFNHRAAVIKTMTRPMQPSEIKRILKIQKSRVRISANNVRDVMRVFVTSGIVQPVKIRKKKHLRYELTESGTKLRQLLLQAEAAV
jgi:DNA-binding transcriptional regulator GbsR (MarR family)